MWQQMTDWTDWSMTGCNTEHTQPQWCYNVTWPEPLNSITPDVESSLGGDKLSGSRAVIRISALFALRNRIIILDWGETTLGWHDAGGIFQCPGSQDCEGRGGGCVSVLSGRVRAGSDTRGWSSCLSSARVRREGRKLTRSWEWSLPGKFSPSCYLRCCSQSPSLTELRHVLRRRLTSVTW